MIREVWKTVNISTLLILPIFDDIVKGSTTRKKPFVPFCFLSLCFEYGLQKAYLFREEDVSTDHLYLVFDSTVLEDKKLTNSSYYSLSDRLINCKYYERIERHYDYIIVTLRIPEHYKQDVRTIISGNYSKVSKEYKELLRVKYVVVPRWNHPISTYLIRKNFAYGVVSKNTHLKKEMANVLGDFPTQQEFYEYFEKQKETLILAKL